MSQVEKVSVDPSIWLKEKWNPGEVIAFCNALSVKNRLFRLFSKTFVLIISNTRTKSSLGQICNQPYIG